MLTVTPESVDFGIAGPDDRPRRTITVRDVGSYDPAGCVRSAPTWLQFSIRQGPRDRLAIELQLDPARLSASGRQTASVELDLGGEVRRIRVAVTAAGIKSRASTDAQPDAGATQESAAAVKRSARPAIGTAPLVTVGVVGLAFWEVYSAAAVVLATVPNGQFIALAVVGGVMVIYAGIVLYQVTPPRRQVLDPRTASPAHKRLLAAVDKLWDAAKLPAPKVVVRRKPAPTMYVYGLVPKMSCLYVNQGLLAALQEDAELEAALAHELAHQQRWDTIYMAFLGPILWITATTLGLVFGLFVGISRAGRHGPAPFTTMMMISGLKQAGWMGPVVLLMIVFILVFVVMYAAMAAAAGIGIALFVLACLLKYSQYIEREADLAAARAIGDPDRLLAALARCVDHFPVEMQIIQAFAAKYLEDPEHYALADIVAAVKSGVGVQGCASWRNRHLRTHPPVLERIAHVVKKCGSQIA
ncbi:MAG: M48 family metalloprotease [Planctomycetes bacterium]|nr:M48 family metalloprotease [Planctomycetota bacterium]